MKNPRITLAILLSLSLWTVPLPRAGAMGDGSPREKLSLDAGWRFALGHATDPWKDFRYGTSPFTSFAKAGYGDGPATVTFDDRAWRVLDLPHDWAVELPFDPKGVGNHGFKALGLHFPQNSVGWYRRAFDLPASDLGRRVVLKFDGIFRDSQVWVNGFYMGREEGGYGPLSYDVTEVLQYGKRNVVAVRVDASLTEGWFYEGAGIYRHAWLVKTGPLHVAEDGVFVSCVLGEGSAQVTARTELVNEGDLTGPVRVDQAVMDERERTVAHAGADAESPGEGGSLTVPVTLKVDKPLLWDLDSPHLYHLVTTVMRGGETLDRVETPFGIRTVTFDPDKGFFLNGRRVELKGTCNHQDAAGVGIAVPDSLWAWRVKKLKGFGCNATRCAHNPPSPELLDACDRLGMLVLDENRLMGTGPTVMDRLAKFIRRDRNHPCVLAWSIGNEEWYIEGNDYGERITVPMQALVKRLDPTRRVTQASSGGWGQGISRSIDVMGYNYLDHGDPDAYHKAHPEQPSLGTEDSDTHQTRGVWEDDPALAHEGPTDRGPGGSKGIEGTWKWYSARPWMAGVFLWTGFDYRGEPTPFDWPAIASQYGVVDLCGFPKDCYHYLRAWWRDEPYLALAPHWNWAGSEGKGVTVRVFSNCDEVELKLNGRSLGRRKMERLSRLDWTVPYERGTLAAEGYGGGKPTAQARVETTGGPKALRLTADRSALSADGCDAAVVTVESLDAKGRWVPNSDREVRFTLQGPGRILGVGNGDPSSHEADRVVETVEQVNLSDARMKDGGSLGDRPETAPGYDDSGWAPFFSGRANDGGKPGEEKPKARVVRCGFDLPGLDDATEVVLYPKSVVDGQDVYVNGHKVASGLGRDATGMAYPLPRSILRKGRNVYAVVGSELLRRRWWEELNDDPGCLKVSSPAVPWARHLFNGFAQVIVQGGRKPGEVVLKAASKGLEPAVLRIHTKDAPLPPSVPVE